MREEISENGQADRSSYSNVPLAVGSLVRKIRELERLFGIPENLKKAGIEQEDLLKHKDEMIRDALADTCTKTNPRVVGAADIEAILKRLVLFKKFI